MIAPPAGLVMPRVGRTAAGGQKCRLQPNPVLARDASSSVWLTQTMRCKAYLEGMRMGFELQLLGCDTGGEPPADTASSRGVQGSKW